MTAPTITEITEAKADELIEERKLKSGALGTHIALGAFASVMIDENRVPVILSYQDANGNHKQLLLGGLLTGKHLVGKRVTIKATGLTPVIERYISSIDTYHVLHDDGGMGWVKREQFELIE